MSVKGAQVSYTPVGTPASFWVYISMLWCRHAIFESNGDKLSSSAECKIRTQCLWNRISSRMEARWQADWAIEDQAKNLNSIAHPYDQLASSPLDPTAGWFSHLVMAIYMFVVVNFDALVVIFETKGGKLSSSADCRIRINGWPPIQVYTNLVRPIAGPARYRWTEGAPRGII